MKPYYTTLGGRGSLIFDIILKSWCYFVYMKDAKVAFKNSFHLKYLYDIYMKYLQIELPGGFYLGSA